MNDDTPTFAALLKWILTPIFHLLGVPSVVLTFEAVTVEFWAGGRLLAIRIWNPIPKVRRMTEAEKARGRR